MIPYGRQSIDEDDIAAVTAVLRGKMLTGGPAVASFEDALACAVGAPHAIACANGTAALHLALMALGVGPGNVVVVPSMTFLASANAVRFVGAEVCFADVDPDNGLLTPETLAQAIPTAQRMGRVRAVIPVHLNGRSCDMTGIASIAREHGLGIIEDACHALGGHQVVDDARRPVGSTAASDMACFSFHPVKTVAMGEGGAVTTADSTLAERLRRLRNHGMVREPNVFRQLGEALDADGKPNPWYYEMLELGYNYRASDINCALGTSQIRKLPDFLERRQALAAIYDMHLTPLAPALRPVPRPQPGNDGWHLYPLLIDFPRLGRSRAAVMHDLAERGIGTQVHYLPVHRQPYYRKRYPGVTLPGADAYYARCLSLPLFPAMTAADLDVVIAALTGIVRDATS